MSFSISHVLFVLDSSLHPWNQYPEQHSAASKTSGLIASPLPSLCLPLPPQSQECMHGTCEAGLANFNILSVTLSIGAWHQNGSGWMLVLALPQGDGIGQLYFFGWRGPREDGWCARVGVALQGPRKLAICPRAWKSFYIFSTGTTLPADLGSGRLRRCVDQAAHVAREGWELENYDHIKEAAWWQAHLSTRNINCSLQLIIILLQYVFSFVLQKRLGFPFWLQVTSDVSAEQMATVNLLEAEMRRNEPHPSLTGETDA